MSPRSRWSPAHRADDGFAMIVSLMLIMIVGVLSLAMGAVVIAQVRPTMQARKTLQTVNAAESGLQLALNRVRGASDASGRGRLDQLPCTSSTGATFRATGGGAAVVVPGATVAGSLAGASGAPKYAVSIAYFDEDPSGKDPSWMSGRAQSCPLTHVPGYAALQSFGSGTAVPGNTAAQGNRNQVATYTFSSNNVNVAGGRLRSFGTQQCVDAGSAPVVGRTLTLQPCQAIGTPSQTWLYRADLTLFYGGDPTLNLCIQSPATGNLPTLRTCTGSGNGETYGYAPGQQVQEWGFNDNGHFAAAKDDGTVTNGGGGSCLQPQGATGSTAAPSGAALIVISCDSTTSGPAAFDPDPQVGAGKAGGSTDGVPGLTKQFVNYAQFGRCLDITGQNVGADHEIAYPCKQAPNSSKLTFNQVWDYTPGADGYGPFYVTKNGVKYCLQVPATGKLVTTPACAATPPATQLWKASGLVPGDYASSYRLVNKSSGTCLAVSPLSEAVTFGSSNIVVMPCDGSSSQKWNAPPNGLTSRLGNIREPAGSS